MGETPSTAAAATSTTTSAGSPPAAAPRRATIARIRAAGDKPWALDALALAATCFLSLAISAIVLQLWDSPDLRVPFQPDGDAISLLSAFKGFHDHGWIWTNSSLGAPFGEQYYDYGSIGPDNLHWVMAWAMTRFVSQPGTVYNAFLLISFPMAAAAAYAALRWLDVGRLASLAGATLFALVPYHFDRGLGGHLLLAESAAVPLIVYLAIAVATRRSLWARRASGNRLTVWLSGTTLRTLALCVIVASSGIYYAAFALLFVAVGILAARLARNDNNFSVFNGGAALVGIGAVLVFNLLPTVVYHRIHGSNSVTGQRTPDESLTYGLNLIGQILPPPTHRLGFLDTLSDKYWKNTALPSEGSSWGGTIATIGLALLVASMFATLAGATASRWLADARLRAASLVTLVAILMGATGAGGAFVAFIINPSLRAWNRISIVIVFCGLLAVALGLDAIWRRAQGRGRRASIAFAAAIPVLILFGAWDQTSKNDKPNYALARQQWSNDAHFVQKISNSLGGHGEVYQIPYLPFPESPPIRNMSDYSPMRGYLHAGPGIKWSYGAMKGRPADWQEEASTLPLNEQIPAVAAAGFDGLWIDTAAYANPEGEALGPARALLGGEAAIGSDDGRFQYFDLRPLQAKLKQNLPAATISAVGAEVLHPLQVSYGDGFYPEEQTPDNNWRWARSSATINLENPAKGPRVVLLDAGFSSFARAHVTILLDGKPVARTVSVPVPGREVKQRVTVPAGKHALTLTTDAPSGASKTDPRDLRLQLIHPEVVDAAFGGLPKAAR